MPPRKKKVVQKRTPGFTTIDKEVHDLLDTVRPVAERVYRKLHQRVNIKRGDHKAFPTFEQLKSDTGITNHTTLDKAIRELEAAGLITVDRTYNKDLKRMNGNIYKIVPTQNLSHVQNYRKPRTKLQNPTYKTVHVTRMKGTSMNITNTKKGNLKPKKEKRLNSPPPAPVRLSPDAINQKERGHVQNRTGSGPKPISVEELRAADEKWKAREEYLKSLS